MKVTTFTGTHAATVDKQVSDWLATSNVKADRVKDDPASTSSIDRLNVAAGQPVCVDQDALAAAFFAAVAIGARPEQIASYGCHMIPNDAQVEILQRFPSGFQFLRLVKVNVTSPSQPDATVGYTFEISR